MKKRRLWKSTAVIVAASILMGVANASLQPDVVYAATTTQQEIDKTKDEMNKLEDQLDKTQTNINSLEKKTNKL